MTGTPTLTKRDPIRSGPPTVRAPTLATTIDHATFVGWLINRCSFTRPAPFPICRLQKVNECASLNAQITTSRPRGRRRKRPTAAARRARAARRAAVAQRWLGSLELGARPRFRTQQDLVGLKGREPARAGIGLHFRGEETAAGAAGFPRDRRTRTGSPTTERAAARRADDPRDHGSGDLSPAHTLVGTRLHLVNVSGGAGAMAHASTGLRRATAADPLATPSLSAGAGQPPIMARRRGPRDCCHERRPNTEQCEWPSSTTRTTPTATQRSARHGRTRARGRAALRRGV